MEKSSSCICEQLEEFPELVLCSALVQHQVEEEGGLQLQPGPREDGQPPLTLRFKLQEEQVTGQDCSKTFPLQLQDKIKPRVSKATQAAAILVPGKSVHKELLVPTSAR